MKKLVQFITLLIVFGFANGQGISKKLQDAAQSLKADDQLKSGMLAFYVLDQKTGTVVINENGTIGLPVASSQKVLTSVASLELLGTAYRYQTSLAYSGIIQNGTLNGNIYIAGSGDPTLGSWRYDETKEQVVLNKWIKAIKQAGINRINGSVFINHNWGTYSVPGGWIWDDIGNYYGAGATGTNWRENQYDIKLKSGNSIGDKVSIVTTIPKLYDVNLTSELTTGKPGSGDNAYIYLAPYSITGYIRGTIPPNENAFTISGSFPDPSKQLINVFYNALRKQGIESNSVNLVAGGQNNIKTTELVTHASPPLDSINYWFLRKSINLYGEALAKTVGFEKSKEATTEAGLDIIKAFWKERGIEPTSVNMKDGSGLSPQNRVTAEALAKVMLYAKSQPYFNSFNNALPEFNGIKMKSGTIGGVKSFTGYVNGYTFAIVVTNYNGSTNEIVRKMYRLLNLLK
ncbi:D-alanyl-D-alanine carboxypeptidase/D-alanyl-D-alanine-endopeptidase [Segetibacter sp.]|uniref:D-alanyl-D-alanine carboxypeptidase/D-alanyl-D-alanine endopeptidase n=1 Tax=Segetibacter sp. TaxID=2231182 RepID=UPI00260FF6E1|nr:D-alanyl-D-alanine carboxypeptidase/D-alanyl-D-alanine-endopeptidase [Segetibacter sp.]MCW3080338.1 D-alanyl-D-alaninecarboxypeptidase/D-alanyl-D-alanine-endopeptidase [Segetibacter sp.]